VTLKIISRHALCHLERHFRRVSPTEWQ